MKASWRRHPWRAATVAATTVGLGMALIGATIGPQRPPKTTLVASHLADVDRDGMKDKLSLHRVGDDFELRIESAKRPPQQIYLGSHGEYLDRLSDHEGPHGIRIEPWTGELTYLRFYRSESPWQGMKVMRMTIPRQPDGSYVVPGRERDLATAEPYHGPGPNGGSVTSFLTYGIVFHPGMGH
jgi:hypothetical protein